MYVYVRDMIKDRIEIGIEKRLTHLALERKGFQT